MGINSEQTKSESKPRFFVDDGEGYWQPMDSMELLELELSGAGDGEIVDLQVMVKYMTDEEYAAIPEEF